MIAEQLDEGKSLSSAVWSPVDGDQRLAVIHERTRRGGAGDLGAVDRRLARPRARPRGTRASCSTGGPTRRRCCSATSSRAVIVSTGTTSSGGDAHRDRAPRGPDQRRARSVPTARSGSVTAPEPRRPADPRRRRRRGARARRASAPPRAVPTSRGGSRTSTVSRVHGLLRHPRGRRAVPVPDASARRSHLARRGSVVPGGPGLRRRRVRGGAGELPRLDGLRRRVARRLDRRHRRPRARGSERRRSPTSSPRGSPIPTARRSAAGPGAGTSP